MKLIIANWKMHPANQKQALALTKASDSEGVVVCPPFPFLAAVSTKLKHASLGAQDVFFEDEGAFTGQVGAKQLKSFGVKYVIVGHSERRRLGEGNDVVAKKILAVLQNGMTPILCIGESRDEHITGRTKEILERQLDLGLSLITRQVPPAKIIVAYEPVWAISGGDPLVEPDTPEDAGEIVAFIRERLRSVPVRPLVVYGGSVNVSDLESFLSLPGVDGVLVGGASIRPEFMKMVKIAGQF